MSPRLSFLCERFTKALHGKGENDGAQDEKPQQLRPEDSSPDPLEEDGTDDDQVVAERICIGCELNHGRHVLDGEDKTGEEHGREGEHERAHHCLLLGAADGRGR